MNELMEFGNALDTGMMTAAEMTHALCELGNGSMSDGIFTVFEGGFQLGILEGFTAGWETGWKAGHTKGILTGATVVAGGVAVAGLCIWGKKKYEARKTKNKDDYYVEVSDIKTDGDITLQERACMHAD